MRLGALGVIVAALFSQGCSLKKLTVSQTAGIFSDGIAAFHRESDIEFAADAIPANLKTLEVFHMADPQEPQLLRLLAETTMSYAFGFIEDQAEVLDNDDPEAAEHLRTRALQLHLRARNFGLRLLARTMPKLADILRHDQMPSDELLSKVSKDDLPGLYWSAAPWAAAINAGRSEPSLITQLPIVRRLMERCVAIDPQYYWAGPLMTLGAMDAVLPKALGGRPDLATKNFTQAIALTDGHHLMMQVLYARMVGVQNSDRDLFERLLKQVLQADAAQEPDLTLTNRLAQRRAQRYLDRIDDLFL
ncbi:MAG: TRAP transporter TatT component family protein [Myxococcota bacterium]